MTVDRAGARGHESGLYSSPGAPILSALAGHQSLVDQIPAERGKVGVKQLECEVDLPLRVPDSRIEFLHEPLEDDPSLRPLVRDAGQPVPTEERAENPCLLLRPLPLQGECRPRVFIPKQTA